jgi:aldehyde:ferredoxin oxidoreductase
VLAALASVTGWSLEAGNIMTLGKRIVTIKRMLNLRLGLTQAADRLPPLLLQPLKDGGTEGHVPDVSRMLRGAYSEFGWDAETGRPSRKTLDDLGLSFCL